MKRGPRDFGAVLMCVMIPTASPPGRQPHVTAGFICTACWRGVRSDTNARNTAVTRWARKMWPDLYDIPQTPGTATEQ